MNDLQMSSFILPTIFSIFIGIWYYVLMSELLVLEDVPLHVFTVIARTFYGSLVSFPFEPILMIILSRIILWVILFVMTLDVMQLIIIFNRFNHFELADAFAILFSFLFIIMDLFFILTLYHTSTIKQLEVKKVKKTTKTTKAKLNKEIVNELPLTDKKIETKFYNGLFKRTIIKF